MDEMSHGAFFFRLKAEELYLGEGKLSASEAGDFSLSNIAARCAASEFSCGKLAPIPLAFCRTPFVAASQGKALLTEFSYGKLARVFTKTAKTRVIFFQSLCKITADNRSLPDKYKFGVKNSLSGINKAQSEASDDLPAFNKMQSETSDALPATNKVPFKVSDALPATNKVPFKVSDALPATDRMPSETSDAFTAFNKVQSELSDAFTAFNKALSEVSNTFAQVGKYVFGSKDINFL